MSRNIVYTAGARRDLKNTVSIVRIMYGGRDIRRQLNETKIEY